MQRTMTYAEMDSALQSGQAAPLCPTVLWLVRYQDTWWALWERGWLAIEDEAANAEFNELAADLDTSSPGNVPSQAPDLRPPDQHGEGHK